MPRLTDAMGPIHSCLTLPAFVNAPYDALIMATGTPAAATLTRAVVGMNLAITSHVPTKNPVAADVLPMRPVPGDEGCSHMPVLCVTVATGGTDGSSELFCWDDSPGAGERDLRVLTSAESSGFDADSRTLCAVCCAPSRVLQVTARALRLCDLRAGGCAFESWSPAAAPVAAGPRAITAALVAPFHQRHGPPEHAVVLSATELMSVRLGIGDRGEGMGLQGGATRPLPHSVTGGDAFRMHDGTEAAVTGFWVESLAFSVLRADTLDVLAEHTVSPAGPAADSSGAAVAFASVVGERETRVLVGGLIGQVSVYRLETDTDGEGLLASAYRLQVECTVCVGRTHVRFAQLWDDRERAGVAAGGAGGPSAAAGGVLAVAGRNAMLLWPPAVASSSGAAAADDAEGEAPEAAATGGGAAGTVAGLLTAVVALPRGSDVASVCSVGGSVLVWAEAAGGVLSGELDRRERLRRHTRPLRGTPHSIAHCPAVHAVACQVRSLATHCVCQHVSLCTGRRRPHCLCPHARAHRCSLVFPSLYRLVPAVPLDGFICACSPSALRVGPTCADTFTVKRLKRLAGIVADGWRCDADGPGRRPLYHAAPRAAARAPPPPALRRRPPHHHPLQRHAADAGDPRT